MNLLTARRVLRPNGLVLVLLLCWTPAFAEFVLESGVFVVEDPRNNPEPARLLGPATIENEGVWLQIDWRGLEAGEEYRYEWKNPSGQVVRTYRNSRTSDSNGGGWDRMTAQRLWEGGAGEWTVEFFYGGRMAGRWTFEFAAADPFRYLVHVPDGYEPERGMLVVVHGSSYNVLDYYHRYRPVADRQGLVLVAPYFQQEGHSLYNNLITRDYRADRYLLEILEEATAQTGADPRKLYLYGHSAGGQFVHRFFMAYPDRVERLVASAPGWWTVPDESQRFPYGVGASRSLPEDIEFDWPAMFGVPVLVLVGSLDTGRDANLRQTEEADLQGMNRVQRAENWVASMEQMADRYRADPKITLNIVDGETHTSISGNTVGIVEDFLFQRQRR